MLHLTWARLSQSLSTKQTTLPRSNHINVWHSNELDYLAIVSEVIHPDRPGRIKYQSSWWPAICYQGKSLFPDTQVRVIAQINLTYIVEAIS